MRLVFEQIRVGGDRNFAYLLGDREAGEAVIIDPASDPGAVVERAKAQGLKVLRILNTHGHSDHTNGNKKAQTLTGAPVCIFKNSPVPHDQGLDDGEVFNIGDYSMRALYTPGHAEDHLVFHCRNICITGDILFVGKVGGTGTDRDAQMEWESLNNVVLGLPDETTVWPGHDYGCRPSSTIGLEKETNPFLRCRSLEEFQELKAAWSSFKAKHGLK